MMAQPWLGLREELLYELNSSIVSFLSMIVHFVYNAKHPCPCASMAICTRTHRNGKQKNEEQKPKRFSRMHSRYPLMNLLIYSIISAYLTVESSLSLSFDISPSYSRHIISITLSTHTTGPCNRHSFVLYAGACVYRTRAWPTWTINHWVFEEVYLFARSQTDFECVSLCVWFGSISLF